MPKVSVIIPVYNTENYLKKALDSIINQTLKDIEIICINDGSTDNSLSILQDYEKLDSRIKIVDKKNEGQSVARNIGIELAHGEYLGFIDSDDWVDSDYFEKLYNAAIRNHCDIACAGFKKHRKRRTSIKKRYEKEVVAATTNDKIILDNLPKDNYIWNKIYKRTVWNSLGLKFEPNRFFEDIVMTIKILHQMGKMITVPGVYYYYRNNPTSTIHAQTSKHQCDYRWAVKEQKSYAENNGIDLDTSNVMLGKKYYKFFGIPLIKIYTYENFSKYRLFGIITLKKKTTTVDTSAD